MPDSQADAVALLDQDGRLQISRDALSVAKAVQLRLTGIEADVAIDHIESDDATHHLLIDRARAAQFLQYHAADTGAVRVRPLTDRRLQVAPQHDLPFIDLFAGIGGMRLGFEAAGGRCVFSSEWDRFAQKTYGRNFGHAPHGDICKIPTGDIPDHNLLIAGFPCQPFSIAGVSKKNSLGRAHGFRDEAQGTLFFDVARILEEKRPQAFLLENVKNLTSHDKGRTFSVIRKTLREELGYHIHCQVIDGRHVVPQHRERIYIVGFSQNVDFEFPDAERLAAFRQSAVLGDILQRQVPEKYRLSDKLWQYLQDYAAKHRAAGNGFGFGLVGPRDSARTLSARYYKDGSEILIRSRGKNPRRLTPRECARLMGFPESYEFPVSDTQAYRQCGNSVVVPVIEAIAHNVVRAVRSAMAATAR